ncbi:LysE family translocator [Photobacterium sp. TY1-4]|uniref:LysE family translocator n=1 Tax=Photobacterium sp. TY1-4 TaxID=2899122 RepID=UPI0021BE0B93|nr:LysE family translocator [Photobacterium sp. TY1-4]UXI02626.1 LysE family translocator [Photobacterium sp. TY1-4]
MEILGFALLGLLIVMSPGADFVLVLKNSIGAGRAAGLWTALGISLAISVHISYSVLGISYLISQNETLFTAIRYAGSGYLIYLGLKGILTANNTLDTQTNETARVAGLRYLSQGFLCNVLNPKTMLFFLSIFSQVISPDDSSQLTAIGYGLYMMALHGIWFALVALLFTSAPLQSRLKKVKKRFDQVCGAGLMTFGALLATD